MSRREQQTAPKGTERPGLSCTVELYGVARLLAGRRKAPLLLPEGATMVDVLKALGWAAPQLVGAVLRADCAGLASGYVLNINGKAFVKDLDTLVHEGDAVLVLSDQAGG